MTSSPPHLRSDHPEPTSNLALAEGLEKLYREVDLSMISPDPLELVLRYTDPHDQEVAGLLASAWAYGRADIIVRSCKQALDQMGPSPASFVDRVGSGDVEPLKAFRGIVHRFHRGGDWASLCLFAGALRRERSTIAAAFSGWFAEAAGDLKAALTSLHRAYQSGGFADRVRRSGLGLEIGDTSHLVADPSGSSACKRLNLYLRWMVRRDHVDPGPWHSLCPSPQPSTSIDRSPSARPTGPEPRDLIIPLDTHIARLGRALGLTRYATPGWSMARDITQSLARFDPEDPVKYDFALARLGILNICPARTGRPPADRRAERLRCETCPISRWCKIRKAKPSGT